MWNRLFMQAKKTKTIFSLPSQNVTSRSGSSVGFALRIVEGMVQCLGRVGPLQFLELPDQPDTLVEGLIDVDFESGAAFYHRQMEIIGHVLDFLDVDHSLFFEIGFVGHEHDRVDVPVFDSQDLLVEFVDLVEGGAVGHREDQQETFSGSHVMFPHRRKLLLARRVQY